LFLKEQIKDIIIIEDMRKTRALLTNLTASVSKEEKEEEEEEEEEEGSFGWESQTSWCRVAEFCRRFAQHRRVSSLPHR
jgi:hypothetical protein